VDRVVQEIAKAGTAHRRAGLNEVLEAALRKRISMIVVETPDRLARFAGQDLLEKTLRWHGVEVHVIQKHLHSEEFREELKEDLTELIYDSRSLLGEL
jgi:predicted site-specific integrase-resolvase